MSEINPYSAPPQHPEVPQPYQMGMMPPPKPGEGVWRYGGWLIMDKRAVLPDVCVKSNQPANGMYLKRSMYWHHPAIFLSILAGLLIYVILALVLRKSATVYVGLSSPYMTRRRVSIIVGWLVALAGIAMCPLGITVGDEFGQHVLAGILVLGALILPIIGLMIGSLGARIVWPAKITDTHVAMRGCCREFLARFPEWPYGAF